MEKLVFWYNYFNFEILYFTETDFFYKVKRRVNPFRKVDYFRGYSIIINSIITAG